MTSLSSAKSKQGSAASFLSRRKSPSPPSSNFFCRELQKILGELKERAGKEFVLPAYLAATYGA
jgi:hypothetical protein